jgi:type IV secretory pathway VirB6-like protein
MNESVAEALILAIHALGAGILLFIAGVIQKIMDDMDEPAFK